MLIETLPTVLYGDAIALWRSAGLTRPWNDPDADLERAIDGPSSTVLAATEDGRLVGTSMVGHDGHRGWVYYLAVDPKSQRHGVGRALMRAGETWLAERVPKLHLMVRSDNTDALAFYARLGYEPGNVTVLGRWLGT